MWDFMMDKSGAREGFPPRTSVSPANLHSIYFSTINFIITRGWHNRPGVAAVPIASQTTIKKKIFFVSEYYALIYRLLFFIISDSVCMHKELFKRKRFSERLASVERL
jgi:hypothetical protein